MASHERNKNLTDLLCKAKLHPIDDQAKKEKEKETGWFPCGNCKSCKHSFLPTKNIFMFSQNMSHKIKSRITCTTDMVIYVIECRRCLIQYGGSTEQVYKLRCNQWRSDIKINSKSGQVIEHFNTKGHDLEKDFRMIPIEKVYGDSDTLKIRERMYNDLYGLLESGLNTNRT